MPIALAITKGQLTIIISALLRFFVAIVGKCIIITAWPVFLDFSVLSLFSAKELLLFRKSAE